MKLKLLQALLTLPSEVVAKKNRERHKPAKEVGWLYSMYGEATSSVNNPREEDLPSHKEIAPILQYPPNGGYRDLGPTKQSRKSSDG